MPIFENDTPTGGIQYNPMAMPRYIAHYRSNGFDQQFRKH